MVKSKRSIETFKKDQQSSTVFYLGLGLEKVSEIDRTKPILRAPYSRRKAQHAAGNVQQI